MADLRDLLLPRGRIVSARHLDVRFSRAGGPGGQHVNKTETRVDLRLDLEGLRDALTDAEVARVKQKLGTRLDGDGWLQVVTAAHRERTRNLEEAHERMEQLITDALKVQKKRRPTRPTRGSKERRLKEKKQRSDTKKNRGAKEYD